MAWESIKNPKIREIISILSSGSYTPTQLARKLNVHNVVVSRYLKTLKDDNLVKIRRKQNELYYSLDQNQWEKHVKATINLAGNNFSDNFIEHLEKNHLTQKNQNNLQGSKN